jgi:surface antigen
MDQCGWRRRQGAAAIAVVSNYRYHVCSANIRDWRRSSEIEQVDKKALITTDEDQSGAIESPRFATRCPRELGLHADATDPLDP